VRAGSRRRLNGFNFGLIRATSDFVFAGGRSGRGWFAPESLWDVEIESGGRSGETGEQKEAEEIEVSCDEFHSVVFVM
jgi:hypothetical protein